MKNILSLLIFLLLISCASPINNNIIITRDYIQNKYWTDKEAFKQLNGIAINEIQVYKLKIKVPISSTKNYLLEDYINKNILEVDSLNTEQNYFGIFPKEEGIKIYFDRDYNEGYWYSGIWPNIDWGSKKKNIGKLRTNTWYLFDKIRNESIYDNKYLVYVYIDENNETHTFIRNLVNR